MCEQKYDTIAVNIFLKEKEILIPGEKRVQEKNLLLKKAPKLFGACDLSDNLLFGSLTKRQNSIH